jgi:hypothetical protein
MMRRCRAIPQVEHGPFRRSGGGVRPAPAGIEPDADRNQRQADEEGRRNGDEQQQPEIRVVEVPEQIEQEQQQEQGGHHRSDGRAEQRDRMAKRSREAHRHVAA